MNLISIVLSVLIGLGLGIPTTISRQVSQVLNISSIDNKNVFKKGIPIVKTTLMPDGTAIDWISRDSQVPGGNIALPPPLALHIPQDINQSTKQPYAFLNLDDTELGPDGTVPILRRKTPFVSVNTTQWDIKAPPVDTDHPLNLGAQAVGDHWYASSAQRVSNHGGSASYSLYKAWTEANTDFSLLQSAVIRYNVPKPGDNSKLVSQTVEAGWINFPQQVAAPHLFTFFTTNGYDGFADNKGGWNRDVQGWIQVDSQIFPGVTFAPLSTRGGAQYEIKIQWLLYNGNWWLFVLDRWIGYYPGTLFGRDTDVSRSLQTEAGQINFYGEIYDSHPQLTKSDMGSGSWPEAGWQQSAFIRNIQYTDTGGVERRYDGSGDIVVSDPNRYRMVADFQGSSTWGSFMYLGGPGAGGAIGG